jgi:hypothetical protein
MSAPQIDNITFITALVEAYQRHGDPASLVFENYLRWKGLPSHVIRQPPGPDQPPVEELLVSPNFSILAYAQNPLYNTYCTLGASYRMIPHSDVSFGDARGVRYEYLFHAPPEHEAAICEVLLLAAEHPFAHGIEYGPGFVLPIGEPIARGSGMEYLYFTYPFLDDPKIYEGGAYGQIDREGFLIQTLWIFPIYRSEYLHLRTVGVDAFEDLLFERHRERYDAYEFDRLPLKIAD